MHSILGFMIRTFKHLGYGSYSVGNARLHNAIDPTTILDLHFIRHNPSLHKAQTLRAPVHGQVVSGVILQSRSLRPSPCAKPSQGLHRTVLPYSRSPTVIKPTRGFGACRFILCSASEDAPPLLLERSTMPARWQGRDEPSPCGGALSVP